MKVIVQRLTGRLFLQDTGVWTASRPEAKQFGTALEAISFCIRGRSRDVRLLGQDQEGRDVYLYPFGGDPAVRLERKRLRKSIRESRRLNTERRIVRARIDILLAEAKEKKKQFPFKRKLVAEGEPPRTADPV